MRRAEETLQHVVREDPGNADAHYELGPPLQGRRPRRPRAGDVPPRDRAAADHREAAAELGQERAGRQRPAEAPLRPGQGFLRARTAVRVALLALAAAAAAVALAAPRFTWENAGLTVQHAPHHGGAALLGAAALTAVALSGTRRRPPSSRWPSRWPWALSGPAPRVEGRSGRGGPAREDPDRLDTTRLARVELVEPRPDAIRVRARDGSSISVATQGFTAEDRTRLERTIARRVREATP